MQRTTITVETDDTPSQRGPGTCRVTISQDRYEQRARPMLAQAKGIEAAS